MENINFASNNDGLASAALERVKAELTALDANELLSINLEISSAVATVLGVLPEVRALREQLVKALPTFDLAQFDKLEDYAKALSFTHTRYLSATQPPDDLEPVATEATRVREMLLAEAKSLVHRGIVSGAPLEQLKGANGYKNTASDLMVIANVLQEAWPQIKGKTPTTEQELGAASQLGMRLLRIVGLREQGPAVVAEATDLRLRAYTKLLLVYDDARRAVAYLRGAKYDTDDIIPPLHPGRPGRRVSERKDPAPSAPETTPTTTSPAPSPPPVASPAPSTTGDSKGPFMA